MTFLDDCPELRSFVAGLHHSSAVIGHGQATVMDRTVKAVKLKNLYGQEIVWGMFGCERGKFKGKLANSANTEDVIYKEES